MNRDDLKATAATLNQTRAALDEAVYAALSPVHTPAIEICAMVGLDWGTEGKELRGSFLRLAEQGKAELRHGFGWARTVAS